MHCIGVEKKLWIKKMCFFIWISIKKITFPAVASLCYQTSVTAKQVVLDGFLTYQSSTTACNCTLTSSKSTTVKLAALSSLQPKHGSCGSSIRVQSEGTIFLINCYILGTVMVSPTQPATLIFDKPSYSYDSGYCMLLNTGKQLKGKKRT